ncbi:MAG: hypothetical protein ACPG5B_16405 [Chitinophagales bacterium]
MKISIYNYEEFILDFLEGNLSEQKETEMLLFLEQNPHLQSEIDGLLDESLILTADETIVFENKIILKHHDDSAMIGFRRIWPPVMLLAAAIFALFAMNENVWNKSLNIEQKPIFSQQNHFKIDTAAAIEDTLCKIVNKATYLADNQGVIKNKITKNKPEYNHNIQNPIEKPKSLKPKEKPTKKNIMVATNEKTNHGNVLEQVATINDDAQQTAFIFEKPKPKVNAVEVQPIETLVKKASVSSIASLPMRNVTQLEVNTTTEFLNIKQVIVAVENKEENVKNQSEKQDVQQRKLPFDAEELTSDIVSKVFRKQKQSKNKEFSLLNDLKSAFVPEAYSNDTEQVTTAIHISVPVESKSFRFIQKVWKKQQDQ